MLAVPARRLLVGALLVSALGACGRSTGRVFRDAPAASSGGGSGNGGALTGGGGSAPGGSSSGGVATGGSGGAVMAKMSRGVVPMHRLRGAEYSNSIRDLFGLDAPAPVPDEAKPFQAGIPNAQPWVEATRLVAQQLFEKSPLPAPFQCVTAGGADRACALSVITDFGLQAFRRPLVTSEQQAFIKVYDDVSQAEGTRGALEQVVRALLLSPVFLFHVELSDDPDGTAPELLDSYALAARLSFALWATTPDALLLKAAAADLTTKAALATAYDRVSTDPHLTALADGLNSVWLGVDELAQHAVDTSVFPSWNEQRRQTILDEQRTFMRILLSPAQPLQQLLTLQGGTRVGLLGQSALLTLTSTARRTSATRRGQYILAHLFCQQLPPPPPNTSTDLGADYPPGQSERQALASALTAPACQGCHNAVDPYGFALGNFDAIGAYRTVDSQGQPIDVSANLPEGGGVVNGVGELSSAIESSPRFQSCLSAQLASYLIQRDVTADSDRDLIDALVSRLTARGALVDVARRVVESDQFRYRRVPLAVVPPAPPMPLP